MKAISRYCFALTVFVLASTMIQAQRPTTFSDEANNNTTGCAAQNSCYVGPTSCQANFPGANDDSSAGSDQNNSPFSPVANQVVNTVTFDAAPSNLGDFTHDGIDIHNLVYSGFNGKIFANIVLWHSGPPFNYTPKCTGNPCIPSENTFDGHFVVGYTNDNANQVAAQMAFMQRLNIDGIVGNPPGPLPANLAGQKATDVNVNDGMRLWKNAADSSPTTFLFSIMVDHEMWDGNSQCNASGAHANFDPVCVEKIMICNLDFMNTSTSNSFTCALDGLSHTGGGYFGDSRYWKVSGHPVLSYFINEPAYFGSRCTSSSPCTVYNDNQPGVTCTNSADCWSKLFSGISHHINGFSVRPFVIHRDTLNHALPNDGSFRWVNPAQNQTFNDIGNLLPTDACGYACWLDAIQPPNPVPPVALGVAFGKVDHAQSPFDIGDHLIMDAACGRTWLTYLSEPSRHGFSTSHQLQALEVATWDDYDEGTEMETGIDNCVSSFTESLSGNTLSWSIRFAAAGTEDTVDHYTVFYSTDGSTGNNLTSIANVAVTPANNGNYNFTLPNLPATTLLYVKAVGKSLIRNHMTTGLTCSSCGNATPGIGLHQLFFNGCTWQDQAAIAANGPFASSAEGISSYSFSDGQHAYFVANNQHVHMVYFSNSTWQDQDVTVMTGGPSASSTSGLSSYAISDGQHIYFVGTDQHVHMAYFNNSFWQDQDVTVMTGGPLASTTGGISSYVFSDGQHIYFRGTDQHVHMAYFNNTSWQDQDVTVMTGGPLASPSTGFSSYAISDGQHIYFVGSDQHVHMAYFNNSFWQDQDVTGMTAGPSALSTSGISSYSFSDGQHIYFVGSDQHVHMAYFNNSFWQDQDLTAMTGAPLASTTSGISSYAISDGQHIYFVASNQHVHLAYFNNTSWQDEDLTARSGGRLASSGTGLSSYAVLDGQHVYYLSN